MFFLVFEDEMQKKKKKLNCCCLSDSANSKGDTHRIRVTERFVLEVALKITQSNALPWAGDTCQQQLY